MTAEERKLAVERLRSGGCNCCQSLLGAFCDVSGLDFEMAMKLAAPFGGGMGQMREACGAVTGMLMVAGLKYGYAGGAGDEEKQAFSARVRELARRFEEKNGSIICRKLLGLEGKPEDTPAPRGADSPCPGFMADAAEILREWLPEQENKD